MGIEITITHSCANGYQYKLDKIYKFPDGKNQNWIDINDKNLILNK